jgi:hypothetical protein
MIPFGPSLILDFLSHRNIVLVHHASPHPGHRTGNTCTVTPAP